MKPDLDAIRARCEAATAGPWRVNTLNASNGSTVVESITGVSEPRWSDYGEGEGEWFTDRLTLVKTDAGVYGPTMPDAQFIAAARTDIPALLAYVEELERDLCRMHSDIVEISEAVDKDDIPRTIARAALRDWRARMEEIDAT